MLASIKSAAPYLFGVFYVGSVFAAMRQSHKGFQHYSKSLTAYPRFVMK